MHPLQLSQKRPLTFTIESFYKSLGIVIIVRDRDIKRKEYSKKLSYSPQSHSSRIPTTNSEHICSVEI